MNTPEELKTSTKNKISSSLRSLRNFMVKTTLGDSVYHPREDSYLLAHVVQKYASGNVLDLGTGTGIQAYAAAQKKGVVHVVAIDKNPAAIRFAKKHAAVNHKIEFFVGDLFEPIQKKKCPVQKFDTIIFNPPYLPDDQGPSDISVIGGKHGHETIERMLSQANNYLTSRGKILLLFSSLTNKEKIDDMLRENLFQSRLLQTTRFFYEHLYVYLITRTPLLKQLDAKGITQLSLLGKGKRKLVYKARYSNKDVVVKIKRPDSAAEPILREVKMLQFLSRKKLAPNVYVWSKKFFVTDYVPGIFLKDWIDYATLDEVKIVLKKVFLWCYQLDKAGISKKEMHHPWKHVLIHGKNIGFIDFERAHKTNDPKNVSQFVQFVFLLTKRLKNKGFHVHRAALIKKIQHYKKAFDQRSFEELMDEMQL